MDISSVISLGTPAVGAIASLLWGMREARRGATSVFVRSIGLAIALGLLLTLVQVVVHELLCVEIYELCEARGENNMSYWFQSFFAMPYYSIAAVVGWLILRNDRV